MVTDPQMCGLGGFGCATYAWPGGCEHLGFHARAGSRATPDMWAADFRGRTELGNYTLFDDYRSNLGHTSVGTPGVVAGLASLHSRAQLPWAQLIEPAVKLALDGFPAPEFAFESLRRLPQPGMPSGEQRARCTPDSAAWRPVGEPAPGRDAQTSGARRRARLLRGRSGYPYRRRARARRWLRHPGGPAPVRGAAVPACSGYLPRSRCAQLVRSRERDQRRADAADPRPLSAPGARAARVVRAVGQRDA